MKVVFSGKLSRTHGWIPWFSSNDLLGFPSLPPAKGNRIYGGAGNDHLTAQSKKWLSAPGGLCQVVIVTSVFWLCSLSAVSTVI